MLTFSQAPSPRALRKASKCRARQVSDNNLGSGAYLTTSTGDTISAQIGNDGRTHRGYVHQVRRDDIRVAFHSSFKVTASYNVQFKYNRTPIKRQHQALLASSTSSLRLLFPSPGHEGLTQAIGATQYPLTLFNALIGKNALQLQAVKTILRLRSGSAPFVVFGPYVPH